MFKTLAVLAILAASITPNEPAPRSEPVASRCIGPKPLCSYGETAVCVCFSPYGFDCIWMCMDL